VVVIYKNLGIMAEYIAPAENDGNNVRWCPMQSYLTLGTWNPNSGIPLKSIAGMVATVGINEVNIDFFRPIEEATSMTVVDFYNTFQIIDEHICLETPRELWLVVRQA
jgi:hypothetical protein